MYTRHLRVLTIRQGAWCGGGAWERPRCQNPGHQRVIYFPPWTPPPLDIRRPLSFSLWEEGSLLPPPPPPCPRLHLPRKRKELRFFRTRRLKFLRDGGRLWLPWSSSSCPSLSMPSRTPGPASSLTKDRLGFRGAWPGT